MRPCAMSVRVMTPAIIEREDAVTFQLGCDWRSADSVAAGSVHIHFDAMPGSFDTEPLAPPQRAVHVPSEFLTARQNSHERWVPSGCVWTTAKFWSEQFEGAAFAGIGTADHARRSALSW